MSREDIEEACKQWSIGSIVPICCLGIMELCHILRPWSLIAQLTLLATQMTATITFARMSHNDIKRLLGEL